MKQKISNCIQTESSDYYCWGYNAEGRFSYPTINTQIHPNTATKIMDTESGEALKVKDIIVPYTDNIYFIKKE